MGKYIKSFIKDIIPVIIGILIALFINNWNEERKEKKYLSEIISSIELELKETKNDIESKLATQNSLIDTLQYYLDNEEVSLQHIMDKANGVSIPTIRLHSWKALSTTKIELLDYKKISNLATIEEDKEFLKEKSKYLMNFLYDNIGEKARVKKAILIGLTYEIISSENSILEEINELEERIGADHSNPSKSN